MAWCSRAAVGDRSQITTWRPARIDHCFCGPGVSDCRQEIRGSGRSLDEKLCIWSWIMLWSIEVTTTVSD